MELTVSATIGHTHNSTGGNGGPWEVSDKVKLCRFLCYGSEGDLYTGREEARFSMENAGALLALLQEDRGAEVVEEIRRFSVGERAVRPGPSIFALALCTQYSELRTRQAAFKAIKDVCRHPAHLFSFIQYKKELKEGMKCGIWGRALRKAVSDWYNEQDPMALAAAMTKCKQREGWSHQDLLRLAHTKPANEAITLISKYAAKGWTEVQVAYADEEKSEEVARVLSYLELVEKAKHNCDEAEVVALIEEHKLEQEQLLTDHLKSKQVWRALLKEMPLQSVLRTLGKMTANEVLEPGSSETQAVCDRIQSETALKKAKIHPFSVLLALENYKKGEGFLGKPTWDPDSTVLEAMDSCFYKSFTNVEPVGKRFAVAVDVSTSRPGNVRGTSVNTATAAAAITMIFARTEVDTQVLAYSEGTVVPCTVSADMTLSQVTDELMKTAGVKTDCTVPIVWATENDKAVDVFIVLTSNPRWICGESPAELLRKHREKFGAASKLVICDLTSKGRAIGDKDDRGLLSICGFDLGSFNVIRNLAEDLI